MTVWEAAVQAYNDSRADRVQVARDRVAAFLPEADPLPQALHRDLGVVLHDGERGLLVGDNGGAIRYVVNDNGDIRSVAELTSVEQLGQILIDEAAQP